MPSYKQLFGDKSVNVLGVYEIVETIFRECQGVYFAVVEGKALKWRLKGLG